jgi:hypothetical protein
MTSKKATVVSILGIVFIGLALSVVTTAVLVAQKEIPTNGKVAGNLESSINIGIYSDAAASIPCSSIDWGALNPGSAITRTIYIKNLSAADQTLTLSTSGWSPSSAPNVLTLTWNKEGSRLAAASTTAATFTLTVAQNPVGVTNFNFNIIISGSA